MMRKQDKTPVRKLYALGRALWYDPFKSLWNTLVSSAPEKELAAFLKRNLDKNIEILELGCGTALNLEKINALRLAYKNYLGLDFSPDMLHIAKKKFGDNPHVRFQLQDITKLRKISKKFDIILCTWVLSHLRSPATFVNKAQTFLKKDGRMFLIFMSRPRWYLAFWFCPLTRPIFQATCVDEYEIRKIKNAWWRRTHALGIASTMEIKK